MKDCDNCKKLKVQLDELKRKIKIYELSPLPDHSKDYQKYIFINERSFDHISKVSAEDASFEGKA